VRWFIPHRTMASTMNKQNWSEVYGFMSLGCSSFFWATMLRFIVTVPHFELSFYFFLGQWAVAVVLVLVAAVLARVAGETAVSLDDLLAEVEEASYTRER
jgi:hypothetical protein